MYDMYDQKHVFLGYGFVSCFHEDTILYNMNILFTYSEMNVY